VEVSIPKSLSDWNRMKPGIFIPILQELVSDWNTSI